jgi:hypothetical protein
MGTSRVRLLSAVARRAVAVPDRAAHALLLRDLDSYLRLQFLGVASQTGVARALADGATTQTAVATRAGIADGELLEAFLELGVALGELRRRGDRYSIKGRRLRAVAGRSADLKGLAEEVVGFGNVVYEAMRHHLRDGSTDDYLTGFGPIIAEASRMAEPALAPVIRTIAADVGPGTILDVGCGSGIYLAHALSACPTATGLGIDIDPEVAERAAPQLPPGRGEARHGDLATFDEGPFDLVLLLNNIYYWPPDERPGALERLRTLAPTGTAVVASAVPNRQAFNRHLDLICRVGDGSYRLPTKAELERDLGKAGFNEVEVTEPVPGLGIVVAIAR